VKSGFDIKSDLTLSLARAASDPKRPRGGVHETTGYSSLVNGAAAWRGRRCSPGEEIGATIVMQKIGFCLVALWLLVLAAVSPARAEIGPCVSDQGGVTTCGQGPGAARVVDGTTSPSKRLAFAWRAPGRAPTEPPDEAGDSMFTVESLLIRLSDGAVLSSAKGEYWRTGDLQANHIDESVAWSPNSRLAVEAQDSKWHTDVLRLYAIGGDDKVLVLDLQKIIEPAVRTRLRQLGKNDRIYTFTLEDPAVDDGGLLRASVLVQIPKQEGDLNFGVTLQVSQKNGALSAGDVSVRRSRTKS
jgi:hypothetical protein